MTTTTATCTKQVAAMLPDGSHELRACRLDLDHAGVCKYAQPAELTCPPFCKLPAGHHPEEHPSRFHDGPSFGDVFVSFMEASGTFYVETPDLTFGIEQGDPTTADVVRGLRSLASDVSAAADWIERTGA